MVLNVNVKVNASTLDAYKSSYSYERFCLNNNIITETCDMYNSYKETNLDSKISSYVAEYINNYAGKYVGKHGELGNKVSWSTPYVGQCASLVKYYLSLYGYAYNENSYGDAKDYINLKNSIIVDTPKDGDLVIWTGGKYGHIGIYYQGKVFNQNPKSATLEAISKYKKMGTPIFVRPDYKLFA